MLWTKIKHTEMYLYDKDDRHFSQNTKDHTTYTFGAIQ